VSSEVCIGELFTNIRSNKRDPPLKNQSRRNNGLLIFGRIGGGVFGGICHSVEHAHTGSTTHLGIVVVNHRVGDFGANDGVLENFSTIFDSSIGFEEGLDFHPRFVSSSSVGVGAVVGAVVAWRRGLSRVSGC